MTRHVGLHLAVVGLALSIAASQSAWAQRGGGGLGGGGRGFGRMLGGWPRAELATLPDVQTELKMSDEQKTKTTEINEKLASDRRELFGSSFGRLSETLVEREKLSRNASAEVDKLLDSAQQKRLQEVAIQVNGPRALHDPNVVEQLQLTDDQKTKLQEARDENYQAMHDAFSDIGQVSREEAREKFRNLAEQGDARLLGVLTDEQRAKLDEMKGTPLEIDLSPLSRRRGRQ